MARKGKVSILKACSKCGKIHEHNRECTVTKKYYKRRSGKLDEFRSGKAWQKKRDEIKQRDVFLCQVCIRNLYDTKERLYNYKNLQVHHIIPMKIDFEKRLDNNNLITLCPCHHKMAEEGIIPASELIEMINNPPRFVQKN